MKKLLGLVFNRWVLIAVLLAAVGWLIWIVGPLVAIAGREPLASERARWVAIGIVAAGVVLMLAWQAWRALRRQKPKNGCRIIGRHIAI